MRLRLHKPFLEADITDHLFQLTADGPSPHLCCLGAVDVEVEGAKYKAGKGVRPGGQTGVLISLALITHTFQELYLHILALVMVKRLLTLTSTAILWRYVSLKAWKATAVYCALVEKGELRAAHLPGHICVEAMITQSHQSCQAKVLLLQVITCILS